MVWTTPDDADVSRALSAIGDPVLRRLFFNELENPEWLGPLERLGAFIDPGVTQSDDGQLQAWPWPEGVYLARVAERRPSEVTSIALGLSATKNPWVQRSIVEIASIVPISDVIRLAPQLAAIAEGASAWIDFDRFAIVVGKLLDARETAQARRLLSSLFQPVGKDDDHSVLGARSEVGARLDPYHYRSLLSTMAGRIGGMGMPGLRLVAGWLISAIEISSGNPSTDWGYWRSSIRPHEQNLGLNDILDSLVDAVRAVALQVCEAGDQEAALTFLDGVEVPLLRRIGIEVAASMSERAAASPSPVAKSLLMSSDLLNIEARPEYSHLARALVPRMSPEERDEWFQLLMSEEWQPSDQEISNWLSWRSPEGQPVEPGQISNERRRLTHRLLGSLNDVLEGSTAARFAELESEFGPIEHPDFVRFGSSFIGPTSPKGEDELLGMPLPNLLSFLRSWEPDPNRFGVPTPEGLARTLEGVVSKRARDFEAGAINLASLRPTYARAIVGGLATAVKAGYVPSPELLASFQPLTDLGQDDADAATSFDDDQRWSQVHRALVDLCAAVVERSRETTALARAWAILQKLSHHADPTSAHEAEFGGSNMDPLTLSLNTVRPAALRGVIAILRIEALDDANLYESLRSDALACLDAHVGTAKDPSLATAAVIGEGLGRVWNVAEDWVNQRKDALLLGITSSDPNVRAWADVVVSVALRMYQPGIGTLTMMRPALEQMFTEEYFALEHTDGWRTDRSTPEAASSLVIWTLLRGSVQRDDAQVAALFGGAVPEAILADAIGRVGFQLMHQVKDVDKSTVPEAFVMRAREFLEWRLDVLRHNVGDRLT